MRILLINPNTTASITERMLTLGRDLVGPEITLSGATGRFGARYVASRASYAIAGHAALDAFAAAAPEFDAVALACFGDPGVLALRELSDAPVVGMAEASCRQASRVGKFAIVTGGERWGPMLEEFVASIQLADKLSEVMTVAPTGAEIERDPDGALALLADASRRCAARGADAVILGGAGLAGLAARIGGKVPVPLIDSFEAVLSAAVEAARTKPAKPLDGSFAKTPPVETIGLPTALATMLAG